MRPTSQHKNFGEAIISRRNLLATALTIGTLVCASKAEGMVDVAQAPVPQDVPAEIFSAVGQASLKENEEPTSSSIDTHKELIDKNCTSIRRRANDIYMGIACEEDGAKYQVIYGNTLEKGWVYSAVSVGGIYKCGFVRAGVLPKMPNRPKVAAKCREFFEPLVEKRYEFFEEYNCPEARPGLEGCKSGTPPRKVTSTCAGRITLYGNFASDDPSPFNVTGVGNGGFSTELPNEFDQAISYRVQAKPDSADGKAIVIRDINDTPTLDWGLTKAKCAGKDDRTGGEPTLD